MLDFMHPVRRSNNPSVGEKKAKRDKKRQRKGKICQRLRENIGLKCGLCSRICVCALDSHWIGLCSRILVCTEDLHLKTAENWNKTGAWLDLMPCACAN
jgi:hypothetical protein